MYDKYIYGTVCLLNNLYGFIPDTQQLIGSQPAVKPTGYEIK